VGEGGRGTPVKVGGSKLVPANCDSSGDVARSELRVTVGGETGKRIVTGALSSGPSLDIGRSSSLTVDCRFLSLSPSSSSSAISISLLRRKELVDEEVDPEAACKEQAAESFVSLSSLGFDISKVVS